MASPGPAPPCLLQRKLEGRLAGWPELRGAARPGEESRSLRPGGARCGRPLSEGSAPFKLVTFIAPVGLVRPLTRIHVGLLGPCFKTGREEYRLFARREGSGGGEAGEPAPPHPAPRRSDRRGSKTRAPRDPRTNALGRPEMHETLLDARRRFLPELGPQTPNPNASRRSTTGGRSPVGADNG